jgi:pimeloyl-ACP methyl ester carboxylesterase
MCTSVAAAAAARHKARVRKMVVFKTFGAFFMIESPEGTGGEVWKVVRENIKG